MTTHKLSHRCAYCCFWQKPGQGAAHLSKLCCASYYMLLSVVLLICPTVSTWTSHAVIVLLGRSPSGEIWLVPHIPSFGWHTWSLLLIVVWDIITLYNLQEILEWAGGRNWLPWQRRGTRAACAWVWGLQGQRQHRKGVPCTYLHPVLEEVSGTGQVPSAE